MDTVPCEDPVSLVCKLCDETYKHKDGPLMLPCLHSFCKPCLTQYIEKEESADNKMSCPTCNDRFPHPKDINQFPVNLRLSHLAKTTLCEKKAKGGKMKCQTCKGVPKNATSFCCNHRKFVCGRCQEAYQRFCDDEDLEFIDIDALLEKGDFDVMHNSFPTPKCLVHKKKEVEFFCDVCNTLICLSCCQTNHHNHKKLSIEDIAEQDKAELQQLTNGVNDALNTMDQTLQQIQDSRDKVKVSAKEATNRINKMCDDLIQAVENRREVLKRKCQEIAEGKDDVLSNQMVEVERMRKKLGYALLHAKDAVHNHSDDEIVSVKKVIEDRVRQVKQLYQQQSMELQEDNLIGMELGETESLVERIQEVGEFTKIPDHQKSMVTGLADSTAIVKKEKAIRASFLNELGNPVQGKCHFQYRLSKVGEDPDEYIPPKVTITHGNNDGTATLGFTPDRPGEYELTIMVRNKPIANKIMSSRESRDYSNFGDMPATNKNVGGQCYGVAVHDNGTVYATNSENNTIKVFRPDGTSDQIENTAGRRNLNQPQSIIIVGDTIYVVNRGNHMVKMYSTDGRYTGEFGGKGSGNGQFNRPFGICTDGNGRVLVADQYNKRIQVFSSEGGFIKSIPCSSAPYDVAVDPVGNIHVALYSEHHIAVYSPLHGRQLDTYNVGGIVQSPISIFIDCEGYRFIGCKSSRKVLVVDSTGTLIASREQVSGSPYGMTIDKNGLVYITECQKNSLLIL